MQYFTYIVSGGTIHWRSPGGSWRTPVYQAAALKVPVADVFYHTLIKTSFIHSCVQQWWCGGAEIQQLAAGWWRASRHCCSDPSDSSKCDCSLDYPPFHCRPRRTTTRNSGSPLLCAEQVTVTSFWPQTTSTTISLPRQSFFLRV